jgi:hypothetical protein
LSRFFQPAEDPYRIIPRASTHLWISGKVQADGWSFGFAKQGATVVASKM